MTPESVIDRARQAAWIAHVLSHNKVPSIKRSTDAALVVLLEHLREEFGETSWDLDRALRRLLEEVQGG